MIMWFLTVMMAFSACQQEGTAMDQPWCTDLCAFIRRDIEITQKLIDDDRVGLQHSDRLTHDDVMRLKGDIERRRELLAGFQEAFRRCLAESEQHGPPAVAVARPAAVRFNPTPEIAARTGQLGSRRCNHEPGR
ncbi:hypothetical protein MCHLDSM_06535 [Mycolicibacterium chlorophenolicum]|uniref:Uncharacterized protein n=1 Tax=Mycolicibacterium chlorophenolicum TaxID=37916 RepID=A0A0J6Y232_9MYCO|nr:hypothetical protein MCHLDSM_06535 [Mycolicibacterium chlorophenolicum]